MNAKEIVNLREIKDRLDGDRELFLEICQIFFADFEDHKQALEKAVKNADYELLAERAHTLKGALSNLAVTNAAGLALELEKRGREGRSDDLPRLFSEFLKEIEAFREFAGRVRAGELW